ncbi:MAG: lysylphosphatidylglycerol synthase domain-containing protein [Phycisphaerales bacterium JB040]
MDTPSHNQGEREAPAGAPAPAHPARRALSVSLQIIGFVVGVGLLVWVFSVALRDENREQLKKLADASAWQLSGLFALTALSITLNGLMFWVLIFPVRRLRSLDVVAVNALATGLSYLPFKLSLIARVAIHRMRDGLPIATFGAWMIAVVGSLFATVGPIAAASAWRKGIDGVWIVTVVAGVLGANVVVVLMGRLLEGGAGLARIRAVLELVNLGRLADGERFGQAHLGLSMVARFEAFGAAMLLRLGDLAVQAARFLIAASVLGVDLSFEDAALLGACFFLIGALSPSGEAGLREGGTLVVAELIGISENLARSAEGTDPGSAPLVIIILFVAGTESVVRLVAAGFSVVWLRADRLITASGRARWTEDATETNGSDSA